MLYYPWPDTTLIVLFSEMLKFSEKNKNNNYIYIYLSIYFANSLKMHPIFFGHGIFRTKKPII